MSNQSAGKDFIRWSDDEKDLRPGSAMYDEDGNRYLKCQNLGGGVIKANETVEVASLAAAVKRGVVIPSVVVGANPDDNNRFIGTAVSTQNSSGQVSDIASGSYFWVQSNATVISMIAGETLAPGDEIYLSNIAGAVKKTAGVSVTGVFPIGYSISASTTATNTLNVLRPGK